MLNCNVDNRNTSLFWALPQAPPQLPQNPQLIFNMPSAMIVRLCSLPYDYWPTKKPLFAALHLDVLTVLIVHMLP